MKYMNRFAGIIFCTLILTTGTAQVKVGDNPTTIESSAVLEMESTGKGILIPRMTIVQRQAISTPATALLVYQTDSTSGFYYFDGTYWQTFLSDTVQTREGGRSLNVVGKGTGTTKPTTVIIDNTVGEQFGLGDELYFDISDLHDYKGGDMGVEMDFCNMSADNTKSVQWSITYKIHQPLEVVSGTSGTIYSGDISLTNTLYQEYDIEFTIPEAELVGAEAVHFKVTRETLVSGIDPAAGPTVLHANVHFNVHR